MDGIYRIDRMNSQDGFLSSQSCESRPLSPPFQRSPTLPSARHEAAPPNGQAGPGTATTERRAGFRVPSYFFTNIFEGSLIVPRSFTPGLMVIVIRPLFQSGVAR